MLDSDGRAVGKNTGIECSEAIHRAVLRGNKICESLQETKDQKVDGMLEEGDGVSSW